MRLSKKLYRLKQYRDAFLYLHLSLEHLLKFIWIKSQYSYMERYKDAMPTPLDSDGKDIEYSHDNSHSIKQLLIQLDGLSKITSFRNVLSVLATSKNHGKWTAIRYDANPFDINTQQDFKNYYDNLRKASLKFAIDLHDQGVLV